MKSQYGYHAKTLLKMCREQGLVLTQAGQWLVVYDIGDRRYVRGDDKGETIGALKGDRTLLMLSSPLASRVSEMARSIFYVNTRGERVSPWRVL